MLKNYLLRKPKRSDWMIMVGYDFKTVKKSEVSNYLENGWEFIEERYIYFSDFKDWFEKSELSNKLAIISLIIGSLLSIIFGLIS